MKALTEQTPVEIDRQLAPLWEKRQTLSFEIGTIQQIVRDRLAKKWLTEESVDYINYQDRIAKLRGQIGELNEQVRPFNEEFTRRGGWHRYFLVPQGHIHRETNCSTCYPTTGYSWLIDLADADETALVETYGDVACTVCFPDAPALPGWRHVVLKTEEQIARAEKLEASRAAKAAKALVHPIRTHHDYTVSTVSAAITALRSNVRYTTWGYNQYLDGTGAEDKVLLREALELKGFTPEQLDEIEAKAVKAAKKAW